ncbi:hypothetical protein WCP94_001106 [Bilophila wadsworthia]
MGKGGENFPEKVSPSLPQTCQRGARPSLFKIARLYESLFQGFPEFSKQRNACSSPPAQSLQAG